MTKCTKNVIATVLSLVIGGLLYVILRENTYIAQVLRYSEIISLMRQSLKTDEWMWISYYLPDYLWGLALTCSLIALVMPTWKGVVLCGFTAVLCGMVWELLQFFHVIRGTGDLWDVIMYFSAGITGLFINSKERET